tara:strand:- start:3656 stop:5122 length:1467 start_codon:yes stop_codon:yes gene_type:complete
MKSEEMPVSSIELLIQHYESQMKRRVNQNCILVPTISSLELYKDVNDGLREALARENANIKPSEEKESLEKKDESNTCAEEESLFNLNVDKKEFSFEGADGDFEVFFKGLSDKKRDKFEDCWGCDLRPTFDWQIKPVNFLSEIEEVIDAIQKSVDSFIEQINPRDFFKDLCPIFDMFDSDFQWMCGADLMALMNAIQLVLARYMNQSISIDISATSVLGPLIKFIADGLTSAMESIRDILIAPIDCIRTVLVTTESLVKEFKDLSAMGETVFNGIAKPFSPAKISDEEFKKWEKQSSTNDPLFYESGEDKAAGELLGSLKTKQGKGKLSYSFDLSSDLDGIFKKNRKEIDANQIERRTERGAEDPSNSFLQKMIMTINTAEKFINEFFANLIFSVKSLNNMIVGNVGLNLKLAGTILFVIDLINVVTVWIRLYEEYGVDGFSKLCDKIKEGDEAFINNYLHNWSILKYNPDDADVPNSIATDINTCET